MPPGWAPQPPQPKPSKLIPILVALAVLLVVGGGGAAAYYIATRDDTRTTGTGGPTTPPATTGAPVTSAAPETSAPPTDDVFNPFTVQVDDCVANAGTNAKPKMSVVECTPGVYKVIKIFTGTAIKQNDDDKLTDQEAQNTCKGTGFTFFYKNNYDGLENDIVFCMTQER
ncbi:hypothetical protein ACFQX7_19825 [Luedemannella flava]